MFALSRPYSDQPKTFAHQKTLPKLPVPQLEPSLDRYVKSLKPVIQEQARLDGKDQAWVQQELSKRTQLAQDFAKQGGLGRTLHERLVDVDRAVKYNWLDETYWIRVAYHSWRVPLAVNSNWWILCANDQDIPAEITASRPKDGEFTAWQIRRAAMLTHRMVEFKYRIDTQDIAPDSSRAGPFDMHQYTRSAFTYHDLFLYLPARWMRPPLLNSIFGVTRIPSLPEDHLAYADAPNRAKHITVMARDQIYELVVAQEDGSPRPVEEVEADLTAIAQHASGLTKLDPAVGVLTGGERDHWTTAREHLLQVSPENRQTLNSVESSLFALSLDDWTRTKPDSHPTSLASEIVPQDGKQTALNPSLDHDAHILNSCAGRNGHNRWFDKAVTISVESNTRTTVLGEHSPCDALIPSIVADYILSFGVGKPTANLAPDTSAVKHLHFVADSQVEQDIAKAESVVTAVVEDSDGQVLWFDEYGADWIKKSAKQSPDAYIQMAMQLAYRKLHGKCVPTYETASTRLYARGRTDVIRTLSEDSVAFVNAMMDNSSDEKRYELLSKATAAHNQYTKDASVGKGCDRYLMGLRLNMRAGESHELFTDELFGQSAGWILSTSGLSAGDRFFGTGFGTVDPSGYGINYLAGPKLIKLGIESKKSAAETSTHKFRVALVEAFREMRGVCEKGQKVMSGSKL